MSAHRHGVSLWLRQRLEETQVCSSFVWLSCNTNSRAHRTAEDLTATSRRLARYEALLNDIMPHVPPAVKAMIEEAREQVLSSLSIIDTSLLSMIQDAAASTSGGSETNEMSDMPRTAPSLSNDTSTSSGGTPRVSLPLPVPSPMGGQVPGPHPPPLARPFENMSPSHSNTTAMPRPNSRASPEDSSVTRLPSITPHGMLIELGGDAEPALLPQIKAEPSAFPGSRLGNSPAENVTPLPGWSRQSDHFVMSADGDLRRDLTPIVTYAGIATPAS